MGVMLERVQNKFACIIGELCGEPDVLSEFAIWLDLRLAEYKSKGMISLECSGETPDPSWLRGHKDKRAKMSQHIERQDQFDSRGSQYNEDLPDEVVERLSPDVPLVKEELTEQSDIVPVGVYRHQSSSQQRDVKVNHGRKRSFTNTSAVAKTSHSDHPYKVQRLSQSPSDSDVEPANQSLMSIIKDSRSVEDSEEVSGNVSVEYSNVNTPDNGNNSTVVPSTSSVDSAERLDGDDAGRDEPWTISVNEDSSPLIPSRPTALYHVDQNQYVNAQPPTCASVKSRLVNVEGWTKKLLSDTASAVATFEKWLFMKFGRLIFIENLEPAELDLHLSTFFPEFRKADGSDYDVSYVVKYRCCLERFLKERGYPHSLHNSLLFSPSQIAFSQLKNRLKSKQKVDLSMFLSQINAPGKF